VAVEEVPEHIRHIRLGGGYHALETTTWLSRPLEEVFAFFTDVGNLERITPPELAFRIVTPLPVAITEGTLIEYRLRLYGMPFGWRTRISLWEPPLRFVDEQLQGPYRTWVHLHRFETVEDGTRMTDRVEYRLPGHPFASLAVPLVRRQLDRIFRFRAQVIRRILGGDRASGPAPSPGGR
jgi:ligand-binding SRPBCC domain-containing protein